MANESDNSEHVLDDDALYAAVMDHLESLRSTLWSRAWSILERGSRVDAATWLTKEIQAVMYRYMHAESIPRREKDDNDSLNN